MDNRTRTDPKDPRSEALREVLKSLSNHFIPKGRITFRETIGEGGFGTVKVADLWPSSWIYVVLLGRPTTVAVKELKMHESNVARRRIACRLAREVKIWALCQHENILEFRGYYLSKDFGEAYLVSPYMKNGNMKDYLARENPSMERRLQFVTDTAKGMQYLHMQDPPIVHGDLKSLNVLVSDEGKALLSDLGLAEAMGDKPTGLSLSTGWKGTVRYCSPEVLNGSPRECSSDIWAWGCLALEIITDNPPYHEIQSDIRTITLISGSEDSRRSPEPSDISAIPPIPLRLLKKCWNFVPEKRPTATTCVEKLGSIIYSGRSTFQRISVFLQEALVG